MWACKSKHVVGRSMAPFLGHGVCDLYQSQLYIW